MQPEIIFFATIYLTTKTRRTQRQTKNYHEITKGRNHEKFKFFHCNHELYEFHQLELQRAPRKKQRLRD